MMTNGPHNPHPPPKALSTRVKNVEDQLSAVRSMPAPKVLSTLKERLEVHKKASEEHSNIVECLKNDVQHRNEKTRERRSKLVVPSKPHSVMWPDIDDSPFTRSAMAAQPGTVVRERLETLRDELAELKAFHKSISDAKEDRHEVLRVSFERLQRDISTQVLLEHERSHLIRRTRKYKHLPSTLRQFMSYSQSCERNIMRLNDDFLMTFITEGPPAPLAESPVFIVMVDVPGTHDLCKDQKHVSKLFKRILRSESKLGAYESICKRFRSMHVFCNVHECIAWCVAVCIACNDASWSSVVDNVYPQLEDAYGGYCMNGPRLRMGVSAGYTTRRLDLTTMRYSYRGECIAAAATLCEAAHPGEMLVSSAVYNDLLLTEEDNQSISILSTLQFMEKPLKKLTAQSMLPFSLNSRRILFAMGSPPSMPRWWEGSLQNTHKRQYRKVKSIESLNTKLLETLEGELMQANDPVFLKPAPEGVLTLVFTDVQGSTELWDQEMRGMTIALQLHNNLMRKAIELFQGYEVKTEGDAFMVAFQDVALALSWCMYVQRHLLKVEWPECILQQPVASAVYDYNTAEREYVSVFYGLRVRMGFNICDPDCQADVVSGRMDYFGPSVNLAARISALGKGGSTVIGTAAFNQLSRLNLLTDEMAVTPLGEKQLKGISKPETVFQLLPSELRYREEVWSNEAVTKAILSPWMEVTKKEAPETQTPKITEEHSRKLLAVSKKVPIMIADLKVASHVLSIHEYRMMHLHDASKVQVPPMGLVTLAFSDIQGSTRLWDGNADVMKDCITKHNRILRQVGARCNAYEVKTEGDAFMMAFSSVLDALEWCSESQTELLKASWHEWIRCQPESEPFYKNSVKIFDGPRVRMGFNQGRPKVQQDPVTLRADYFGPMVNLAARISGTGKGGEIVVGFAAFTEITRLNDERGGSILASYAVHSKGDVNLRGVTTPEAIHTVLPKAVDERWNFWRRSSVVGVNRMQPTFWDVNAGKLEKGKMVVKARKVVMVNKLEVMLQEMLRRTAAIHAAMNGDDQQPLVQAEMVKVLEFAMQLYNKLVLGKNGFDIKLLQYHNAEEQEKVVEVMRPAYDLVIDEDRLKSVNFAAPDVVVSARKKFSRRKSSRVLKGVFNESDARRLVVDFQEIDTDNSGMVHMNEVIGNTNFLLGGDVFDERLFKRFDKDRDGQISVLEVLREFFPSSKVVFLTRWLREFEEEQRTIPKEDSPRQNMALVKRTSRHRSFDSRKFARRKSTLPSARNMRSVVLVCLFAAASVHGGYGGKIKNVVLLMEENRSFDHLMGFFKNPKVNGLKGNESNPMNTTVPNSPRIFVYDDSPYIGPFDPDHSTPSTTSKIYGQKGINEGMKTVEMDGFVEWERRRVHDPTTVMGSFNNSRLPVLSALAQEFNVFDRWFCSVPGPTWPNRLFQLMGTSKGDTETSYPHPDTGLYFGKTIFDQMESVGLDWRFYYADAPLEMAFIEKLTTNPEKVHDWWEFKRDIKNGDLPAFSWVNPRWFVNKTSNEGSNDYHPDHDVRLGEAIMKDVYEMIRAGPQWNETLLIVTFDEHGGFYDHVPTPTDIPAPDDSKSFPDQFDFTRLGPRIPVIAISPWLKKGQVITDGNKPFSNSEFDATSVLSTMKKLFGFEDFLTKRDAWSTTFEDILSEESPRTDCPMHLPDAPKSLGPAHAKAEAALELNHLQQDIVNSFAILRGKADITDTENMPKLQGDASEWITKVTADLKEGKHWYNKK